MTIDIDSNQQKPCKNNQIEQKRHSERGASLISMSMFILTLGFIISGFLALQQKQVHLENVNITADRKAKIDQALNAFILSEGRLPCPAPMTSDFDTATFGREMASCNTATYAMATDGVATSTGVDGMSVQTGAIPVRTLNLPDEFIIDAEDKRFTYAVTGDFTVAGADFITGYGDITVQDQNNNNIGSSAGNAIYALIAQGKDTRGAYAFNGQPLDACGTGVAAANCDWGADATFVDSLYKSEDTGSNTFTQNVAFKSNAIVVNWQVGPWSACTPNCATGDRTRVVTCENSSGQVVPDTYCDAGARPNDSESCAAAGVAACVWTTGAWGNCTPICGEPATSYRTVECLDGDGNVIADSYCTATKPDADVACKFSPSGDEQQTQRCVWYESPWSSCTESCGNIGNGSQSRTVNCRRDDNANNNGDASDSNVNDGLCTTSKPPETQACTNGAYSWDESGFGACSKTCGGGTQTQTVTCENRTGSTVSDCYCSGTKPSESQSCNTQACVVYAWEEGTCDKTCGGGTRPVVCRGDDGSVGADSDCSGTKPSTDCNPDPCAVDGACGSANRSTVSSAPTTNLCDDGSTPAVTGSGPWEWSCAAQHGGTPADCSANQTQTYQWDESGFNACSDPCGGGTQTQTVECRRDSDNAVVADSFCTGTKPDESQECNMAACPTGSCDVECISDGQDSYSNDGYYDRVYDSYSELVAGCPDEGDFAVDNGSSLDAYICQPTTTYSWHEGTYGVCSATACGTNGTQTRAVECRDNNGNTVADSNCTGTKPDVDRPCSAAACPTGSCTINGTEYNNGDVITGSDTNTSCGNGEETSTVDYCCNGSAYTYIVEQCGAANRNVPGGCGVTYDATPRTYSWETAPTYSACSATACGTNGTQTRNVWCERDDGRTVADSNCTDPKPQVSQGCSAAACTYSWLETGCSKTCGGGKKEYDCEKTDTDNSTSTVADSNCGTKPDVDCNMQACAEDGSCGSAAGRGDLTEAPTGSAACSAGERSTVAVGSAGSVTLYSWDCNGTGGSTVNDSCAASGSNSGSGCTYTHPRSGAQVSLPFGHESSYGETGGNYCPTFSCGCDGTLTTVNKGYPCPAADPGVSIIDSCSAGSPTDAECGTADGNYMRRAPTTDSALCSSGTLAEPPGVSGSASGPWAWSCLSDDGGNPASCGTRAPLCEGENFTGTYNGLRYNISCSGGDRAGEGTSGSCASTTSSSGFPSSTRWAGCTCNADGTISIDLNQLCSPGRR